MTEAEVERVRRESQADYIDPARQSAECFKEYCTQECKVFAAEHAVPNVDSLPKDASIQDNLQNVPAYDVQVAVRSALTAWVTVARAHVHMAVSKTHAERHAEARAAVLPILDENVHDAHHGGSRHNSCPTTWCRADAVPRQGAGYTRMATADDLRGHSWRSFEIRVTEISKRIHGYLSLASWLRG